MKQKNNNKLTNKKRTQCEIRNNKVRCFGQVLLMLLISSRRLRIWTLTLPAMIVNNRLIAIFKLANYFIRIFRITLCLVCPSVNFFFVTLLKQFFSSNFYHQGKCHPLIHFTTLHTSYWPLSTYIIHTLGAF